MKILNLKTSVILASLAIICLATLSLSKESSRDAEDKLKVSSSAVPVSKTNFKLVERGQLKNEVKKSAIRRMRKNLLHKTFSKTIKARPSPKKFIRPNNKKTALFKRRIPLRKKKSTTFITSMFSTHRDRAPAGEGAYSIVHKVKRIVDGNIYALKKVKLLNLSEKEKLNALNEVRILASVKSNFVVSYKEAFFEETESCLGIVMEYADKGDLYQKICEYKKAAHFFEESDIWRIFLQMVKGLKSLHELKILHRDLKSANVFLFSDGSAKLGDLNVSKVARRGLGYTQTGTPYYASPEVWKDQPYDSKSDIWSLGCVLYEMITLKPPFRAENMEGLYNKVIKGQISRIPERFSADIAEIVKMLIQVAPEARPNCDQILKHPIVLKRIEYFKSFTEENEDQALLQTIRIPKNLLFLSDKLPEPNYTKKGGPFMKNNQPELPDIRSLSNRKKPKIKESNGEMLNSSLIDTRMNPQVASIKKKSPIKENLNNSQLSPLDDDTLGIKALERREKSALGRGLSPRDRASRHNSGRPDNDLDSSSIIPTRKSKQMHQIIDPSSERNRSTPKYDLPQIKQKKKEYAIRETNDDNESKKMDQKQQKNLKMLKLMPYVNNEHINNIYKIYAPYIKQQSPIKYNKYSLEKNKNPNGGYLKNLEKYYDYYNVYKPMKAGNGESSGQRANVVPNRKLSPIRKSVINL